MAIYKVIIISSEKMELQVFMNYTSVMLDLFIPAMLLCPKFVCSGIIILIGIGPIITLCIVLIILFYYTKIV